MDTSHVTVDHALDLKFAECVEYNGAVGGEDCTNSPLTAHISPVDHVVPEKSQTFRFRTFNFLHRSSEADTQKIVENLPVSLYSWIITYIYIILIFLKWCKHFVTLSPLRGLNFGT